jgi:DNA-binding NarL/FixJ family response regulator
METVEKVIKANPQYLTKTYVWLSAKSVCINRCQKKRIITIDVLPTQSGDESFEPSLEQELIGDSYDHISDLYSDLLSRLSPEELELLEALLEGQMYVVIAENLGISLRTLERRVQELKLKTEDILSTP